MTTCGVGTSDLGTICGVGRALPDHYYDQPTLLAAFKELWNGKSFSKKRLEQIYQNVLVGGRYLALSVEQYRQLKSFKDSNDAYIRCGLELGERAMRDALARCEMKVTDVDHIFFTSVTGIATPSLDARLINRMGFRSDVKRTPIFGLGCVAGAAGIARVADYVRAFPDHVAVLLAVELCSLTLQREDISVANMISGGLFGDGAACVVVAGANHPLAQKATASPRVVATQSVFYPGTEDVMGWKISESGFQISLSAAVPEMVRKHVRHDVDAFLAAQGLSRRDIQRYVCHPGGPKVLEALHEALEVPREALELTWQSLKQIGNLSSVSVMMILADTLSDHRPAAGSYGLMFAMGPGFCSELVLLQW